MLDKFNVKSGHSIFGGDAVIQQWAVAQLLVSGQVEFVLGTDSSRFVIVKFVDDVEHHVLIQGISDLLHGLDHDVIELEFVSADRLISQKKVGDLGTDFGFFVLDSFQANSQVVLEGQEVH